MDKDVRRQALVAAVGQIEKQFGRGAIMRLGTKNIQNIPAIPTGSLGLDIALGVGGLPRGRVAEIFGPESSGKTTLALHVVANAQRAGGVAAYIDAENALDPAYARKLGVDLDNLLISQPDTGEQALEIAETLVRSNAVDVVVVDSVAALVPKAELEGEMGEMGVGLQARLMSQALRKLSAAIARSQTCVIFINQLREKIGVIFGNPETTPGGRALKFYASVRIDIRRVASLKDKEGESVRGNRTRALVVKNKVAPPFRRAEFDILFGEGISRSGEIVDLAVEQGVIEKSGSWFQFGKTALGQGRDAARAAIQDNVALAGEVEQALLKKVGVARQAPGAAQAEEALADKRRSEKPGTRNPEPDSRGPKPEARNSKFEARP